LLNIVSVTMFRQLTTTVLSVSDIFTACFGSLVLSSHSLLPCTL